MFSTPPGALERPLSNFDLRALQVVVAISGAVLMSLEILGSRVLAPAYGSSVYVWGSLITTFLVALAVGYSLGGRIADRRPSLSLLSIILVLGGVLILPSVVWAPKLLAYLTATGWDSRWGTLVAAIILFLPPSLAMGTVTPFGVRVGLRQIERAGTVSGGYSALSTAGSIVGTLLTTFFLIPRFGVQVLLMGLAATLTLCGLLVIRDRGSLVVAGAAFLALTTAVVTAAPPASVAGQVTLLRTDTPYHHVLVTQVDQTRWLRFDNLTQTGVNIAYPDRIIADYVQNFLLPWAIRPGIQDVCLIGLGGGSYPRAVERVRPEAVVDSVEIDPVVRDVALKYFLYKETDNLRTAVEDGRVFLTRSDKLYDLIVLDAYNSNGVPFHLTTREFYETAKARLKPDGMIAANLVGKLMGPEKKLFWATLQAVRKQFGQVYVVGLTPDGQVPDTNVLLFATVSDDPFDLEAVKRNAQEMQTRWKLPGLANSASQMRHPPPIPDGIPELTDAYAPVEALQGF